MLPKELAQYLWTLTGRHRLTGFQGATLLALLACNLNNHAPTARELARHCPHSERSTKDALDALTARGGPALAHKLPGTPTRYALARFAYLLPKKDALPGSNVSGPPPGIDEETPRRSDEAQNHSEGPQEPRDGSRDFCAASPSRAEKLFSSSEGTTTAANAPLTSNDDPALTRALCDFAAHVCKIDNADAALLHALENYGAQRLAAALEQYHYAYTQRRREANNPAGQILAWCKRPERMDRLPQSALSFTRWREKRQNLAADPDAAWAAAMARKREEAAKRFSAQNAKPNGPNPAQ